MTPFRPRDHRTYRVKVPTRQGTWKDRSTGTRDYATAKAMQRVVSELGGRGSRDWDLLDALLTKPPKLTIGRLYDAYRERKLDQLRAELNDLDLRPLIPNWQTWLKARNAAETGDRYHGYLLTLAGEEGPWFLSTLTPDRIERWVSGRGVKAPTQRKYHAALASFVRYLRETKRLESDPLEGMSLPAASEPRVEFLELPDVLRVVDRAPRHVRALFAFLYGTGCDLQVALQVRRRDVDPGSKEVRARGTKSANRDRVVTVADWAWPMVEVACRSLLPDAFLFGGISRWTASDIHRETVTALELYRPGITLHAARHHYAVRMVRAGAPIELVARQLGNTPAVCLRYYSRFMPTREERKHWEREARKLERGQK